jgi:transcriptional regulator with XRE-family HTH domain
MIKPFRRDSHADTCGSVVWTSVGRRLRRRRTELGLDVGHVAEGIGIPAVACEAYERGAPIPASLLTQFAELLGRPVVWFFRDVGSEDVGGQVAAERDEAPADEPVVYTVATIEHRAQALVDSFRQLDLEGQQHLLAISLALTRANANAAAD